MTNNKIKELAEVLAEEAEKPVETVVSYASTLVGIAARMHKRAVDGCNIGWTTRRVANQTKDEELVRSLVGEFGIEPVFGTDPRGGFGFYLTLPKSRRSNSFLGNWGV